MMQVLSHDKAGLVLIEGLNDSAQIGTLVNMSGGAQGYDFLRQRAWRACVRNDTAVAPHSPSIAGSSSGGTIWIYAA